MEYKIASIKGDYPSNYPDSKKYVFTVEGYPHDLSAFSKFPMTVGQEISGDIEVKGQYHNFKWGKKTASSPASGELMIALDKIYKQIYALREEQVLVRQLLQASGAIPQPTKSAYPQHTPTSFDEPEGFREEDLPIF